jgi:hypothetical protein
MKVFITSQWTIAERLEQFILRVLELQPDFDILFDTRIKDTHPFTELRGKIEFTQKPIDLFEVMKNIDIQASVYSSVSIESLQFGKPSIIIYISPHSKHHFDDFIDNETIYKATTPQIFIDTVGKIKSNYETISKKALERAKEFVKPDWKHNLAEFFKSIGLGEYLKEEYQ